MRNGKITASRAMDFMTKGRGKDKDFGLTALSYAKELALHRMGIDVEEGLTTWQMEWGVQYEPDARKIYEQSRGKVIMPKFIIYNDNVGATPDGFVGNDGILEIKCPQQNNHVNYLLNGPEKKYIYQMQFQMMVTNTEWCDFMTFHPHFPDKLKAKVFRIERDEALIAEFIERIPLFVELINGYINDLEALCDD